MLSSLGGYIGGRKGTVLLVSMLLVLVTFSGFTNLVFQSEDIWLPDGSNLAEEDEHYHCARGSAGRGLRWAHVHHSDGVELRNSGARAERAGHVFHRRQA